MNALSMLQCAMLFMTAIIVGCGRSTYPVTGDVVVKPDGVTLPGGTVEFRSDAYIAEGTIAEDGTFELQTRGLGRGALPGNYQVIVAPVTPSDLEGIPREQQALAMEPVDRKYRDYSTTPLRFTVTPDKSQNVFHIELERSKYGNIGR